MKRVAKPLLIILLSLAVTESIGEETVTALDRTLAKTHMRQENSSITIADAPIQAFAPTTIECGRPSCTARVEVSSQFFNVTSGNAVRLHVKVDGNPFPVSGFEIDGGINRPVAHLTTVSALKNGLAPGAHTILVEFDMKSPGGKAEASIRTLTVQVFTP